MSTENKLTGKDLDWCSLFESRVETYSILNIIGASLTEKGRKEKIDLWDWIQDNAGKYLELTGRK